MYVFKVAPHVENLIKECIARLTSIGVPISTSILFYECKGSTHYGFCKYGFDANETGYEFAIAINKYIVEDRDVSDTIAHELLHTVKSTNNHDKNWKYWAKFVNENTPYRVTVRSNKTLADSAYKNSRKKVFPFSQYDEKTMTVIECPLCHNKICVKKSVLPDEYGMSKYLCAKCRKPFVFSLPCSPLESATADERRRIANEIVNEDIIISDEDLFLKVMPYVTKTTCNKLFLYYFDTFPEITDKSSPRHEIFAFFVRRFGTAVAYNRFTRRLTNNFKKK